MPPRVAKEACSCAVVTVSVHGAAPARVCARKWGCRAQECVSLARCPKLLTPAHRLAVVTQSLTGAAFIFGFISISAVSGGGWVGLRSPS